MITFSALVTGWSSILLFSNSFYKQEIKQVINELYLNQKDFIFNVKDLSILLVKDANQRFHDVD